MSENSIPEGFKITELGHLPDEWEVARLGDVAEKFIGGGTPSTSNEEYWNGEIHWTTSKKINGIHLLDGEKKITKRGLEESSTHLIPKDNLVIGTRVGVGKVAINKVDIAISQDLTGAFIDKEKYALEFLAYQICTKEIQNIFKGRARGTTIKGIPRDDLKKIPLKIPPLPEQHRIAAVLSAVQDAKEKTGAVIAAAKSLKKSLMRHLFTYGPVPTGAAESVPLKETEIGVVPEGWRVVRLGDVFKLTSGKSRPRDLKSVQSHDFVYPIYGGNGIMGYSKDFLIDFKTIVLGRVGEYCGSVHISKSESWISDNALYIKEFKMKNINLFYLTLSLTILNLNRLKKRSGQPLITQSIVYSQYISLPPLPTQQKIASILSTVDKKIEAEENKKNALDELFKSLLHNLMTGKVRVNHLEVTL